MRLKIFKKYITFYDKYICYFIVILYLTELLQLNTIAIYSSIKLIKLHRPVKHIFLFFLKG